MDSKYEGGTAMTYFQAVALLIRVRAGDKTPTIADITQALTLTGDIYDHTPAIAQRNKKE